MKTKIIVFIAILVVVFTTNAQVDRTKKPTPGPAPQVKLGEANKFILKNGLTVIVVENHKLPRASASLTIDNTPVFEGEKAGVSNMMGNLLGRGTKTINKDDFNERVDFLGANVSFSNNGAYASSLSRYFDEVLGLLADGIKNSQFTQKEFDKEQQIILDGIKSNEKSVAANARRVEDVLTYGKNHPFGEYISKESINNITLSDVKNNYNLYYKPNNAYLIIQGDINFKKIEKQVKTLFGNWQTATMQSATIPATKNVSTTEINFVNMSNAVQSEIAVINNIDLKLGDKDYFAALLANRILGGSGTARLFMNLREDKGYTYGSYSSIRQNRYAATFKATASVRNVVTDSSVVEMMKEINKIRYQKITAEELKNAKAQYVGSFVINVQKPVTAARYALNKELYNLPDNYYEKYLENINSVTIDDVQNAAIKYFKGDKARIVITGKGIDVLKNLEQTDYIIKYFDKYGNLIEKPEMTLPIPKGMTVKNIFGNYIKAIGDKDKVEAVNSVFTTYVGKVQGIDITMTNKATQNKMAVEISGMGQTFQKIVFDGEKGYVEVQGNRKEMEGKQLEEMKASKGIFNDFSFADATLDRIEPLDDKNAYVVKEGKKELFYDIVSGLKLKEIEMRKGPDGNEIAVPTLFEDYKVVDGVLFPHVVKSKMGPMDLLFTVKEIKINEGVKAEDFK